MIRVRRRPCEVSSALAASSLPPVLQRVYAARGVREPADLDLSLRGLAAFDRLGGIERAVALLASAVTEDRRVLVVGDFDADGATSSALMLRALRAMGAGSVDYLVPNRFEYGYGLTPEIVAVARAREPDLLVTVDNGISSLEGVAAARAAGIAVIVTDHHLPGARLPQADAIVNPNLQGDAFPSKHLAGVGVAFYVLSALRAALRARGHFDDRPGGAPVMAEWLDLVALGTIADVVPLDRNNRILVEQGLRRIRARRCCPGILALAAAAGREPARLAAADIGFAIAPRLNAAGRLEDMSIGIECLLTDDPARARALAERLDGLNRDRRAIESEMQAEAVAALEDLDGGLAHDDLPEGLVVYDPGWHPGVVGILASRLKDRYHRPVIAFADEDADAVKGSARSIPGLHIRDALDAVATRHPGLLARFGGHAMAAGLGLPRGHLDTFRDAFRAAVAERVSAGELERVVLTDGELGPGDLGLGTAWALSRGGPWGQGFPEPLFDGGFAVEQRRIVGGRHLRLRVRPPGGASLDAIAFGVGPEAADATPERVRLIYRLAVNEWQGTASPQLVVEHLLPD